MEFKPDMKVRIVDPGVNERHCRWDSDGIMKTYIGTVQIVKEVFKGSTGDYCIRLKDNFDDEVSPGLNSKPPLNYWIWRREDLVPVNPFKEIS